MKEIKVPEVPRSRMVAAERDAMLQLAMIHEFSTLVKETMDNRSKQIPRARTILGMLSWASQWLYETYLDTMTNEQLNSFMRNIKSLSYYFGVKGPTRKDHSDEFGLWLSFNDLGALSDAAGDRCLTCDLCDGRERSCPLRKALDNLGCDLKHEDNGTGCAYRWL